MYSTLQAEPLPVRGHAGRGLSQSILKVCVGFEVGSPVKGRVEGGKDTTTALLGCLVGL
jgi:hypothetical protein